MQFSIITSSLNSANTIKRCINSVLSQTGVDVEHIIVDGLSSDTTCSIIRNRSEKDSRLKYIIERDRGIYDAWNKAVTIASGEWILFIGADDYLLSTSVLEEVANEIQLDPNQLAFVSCGCVKGPSNTVRVLSKKHRRKPFVAFPYDGPIFSMPPQPALFHSHIIFEKGFRFDASYKTAADKKLFLDLFGIANIQYLDMSSTYFSMGGITNQSGNQISRWLEKERLRKGFDLPIVWRPYFRSALSSFQRDLVHFVRKLLWN